MNEAFRALAHDALFEWALILIALDLVLGVAAAVYAHRAALAYVAEFMHDDVLGKVVPWAAVYVVAHLAPSSAIVGIDMGDVADGLWAVVAAALVGSMLASINDFGVSMPAFLARGEVPPPGP